MAKPDSDVPLPGPARLSKGAGPDEWLESAKQCKYLPEQDMKRLCEIVKECLMEGTTSPNHSPMSLIGATSPIVRLLMEAISGLLTAYDRIQHSARPNSRHNLWRHPWPIL